MDRFSEGQRLEALEEYDILGRDMREELNGLTKMAADFCNTPIALVNLVDQTRQVTKCSSGWNLDVIPRKDGFCHYTIQNGEVMIVEDALLDERFRENRFVKGDPRIRFYAGVPLSTPLGFNLGVLCVIGRETRSLSDEQKEALQLLAVEVMARFESIRLESELMNRQQELRSLLAQKEMLLSEIHHRIKNDLSIISGLLQLEIFNSEQSQSREILQNSQMRIQSMAKVHQMLHSSENIGDLPFHEFITDLVRAIQLIYTREDGHIRIKKDMTPVNLRFKQAMPCALIINELITNAYKHAFPGQKSGTISISITKQNREVLLHVKDDGVGLPADFSLEETDSIGMMLVQTLVDQLHGDIEISSADGLETRIKFTLEE